MTVTQLTQPRPTHPLLWGFLGTRGRGPQWGRGLAIIWPRPRAPAPPPLSGLPRPSGGRTWRRPLLGTLGPRSSWWEMLGELAGRAGAGEGSNAGLAPRPSHFFLPLN